MNIYEFKNIALILGPFIVPRIIQRFRTRNTESISRPLSLRARHVIWFIIGWSLIQIVYAWCISKWTIPENIIWTTGSRPQTPAGVIQTRLRNLHGNLTIEQERLISEFEANGRVGMMRYSMHGPTIGQCKWCEASDKYSYIIYRLPVLAIPFLLNIIMVLILTSDRLRVAKKCRIYWMIGLSFAAFIEFWPLTKDQSIEEWTFWTEYGHGWVYTSMVSMIFSGAVYYNYRYSKIEIDESLQIAQKELTDAFRTMNLVGVLENSKRDNQWYRKQHQDYWNKQSEYKDNIGKSKEYQNARKEAKHQLSQLTVQGLANDTVKLFNELSE